MPHAQIAMLQIHLLLARINYVRDEVGRFARSAAHAVSEADAFDFPTDELFENADIFDIYKHASKGRSQIGGVEIDGKRFFVKEVLHDEIDEGAAETVASGVADAMGLGDDIIPAKKVVIKGQEMIASHYMPGEALLGAGKSLRREIDEAKARLMLLFDFTINNTDRHADNIFLPDGGKPKLIDHGNSMKYELANEVDEADLVFKNNLLYDKILKFTPDSEFTKDEVEKAIAGVDKLQQLAKQHFKDPQQLSNAMTGSSAIREHLKQMIETGNMKVKDIIL
jgi:hypothetical protein